MKVLKFAIGAVCVALVGFAFQNRMAAVGWSSDKKTYNMPNGWKVSAIGKTVDLPGDMPGSLIFIDGGKRAIINTCGYHDHSLNIVNLESGKLDQTIPLDKNWIGLAMNADQEILLSGGKADKSSTIHRFSYANNEIKQKAGLDLSETKPDERFVSSILYGKSGIYVLNSQTDEVLKLNKNLEVVQRVKVGYRPYAIAESVTGSKIAISNWGDKSVSVLQSSNLEEIGRVNVGPHPTALLYHPDGRLFVTNSGADYVSVCSDDYEDERINVGLGLEQPIGTVPVSLALDPDERHLYVANAGNNTVARIDITIDQNSIVEGFIPTNRYPALVAVTPDGKNLVIGTAKGTYGPNAGSGVDLSKGKIRKSEGKVPYRYIGMQLSGQVSILPVPTETELTNLTAQSRAQLRDVQSELGNVAEMKNIEENALRKIKHVIYVIRENRTYDQVLGDLPQGNGDPSLTLFGREVTPNGHSFAENFVLFDNLYTDGECSQAGHQWTNAAYATDFCEKQWVLGYGGKGQINADKRLTSSPGEYIWTHARKAGLKARVYGEYVDIQEDHNSLNDPEVRSNPEKYGYSETFERIFARDGRDTEKVADFIRELKTAEKTGEWPNLMVMALPDDHTHGFSPGHYSPKAMIANNDLAIGQLVEAVSKSRFWKETAIFIIQDDAQDGPDHVDSHRTVGYVVSPYTRRKIVDSTHYTTASMLRTMELMLGLSPMTQYDALAMPMYRAFGTTPNLTPIKAISPTYDINERNPEKGKLATWSKKLDFSDIDKADFDQLNRLLWAGYKPGIPYPDVNK